MYILIFSILFIVLSLLAKRILGIGSFQSWEDYSGSKTKSLTIVIIVPFVLASLLAVVLSYLGL